MKKKRLVSLLLAVLLIVGMIPTNAFAAISQGTDGDQNRVEISMTVSKNFGTDDDGQAIVYDFLADGENYTKDVDSIAGYAEALNKDNIDYIQAPKPGRSDERKDFGEIPKNAMAYFSKVYTSTETSLTDAEVGGLIYLGLKTKMTNPGGDLKGLKSVTYKIRYDSTMFGPAIGPGETDNDYVGKSGDSTQSLTAKKGKFQKTMTINGIGPFKTDNSRYGSKDAADDFDEYAADYIIDPDITSLSQIDDSTYEMTINTQATNIHIPDNAPWDVVVALKVKKAGTSTISIVEKNDSTDVYTSALAVKEESGTALGKDNPVTISTFKSTDSINANDVTVTAYDFSAAPDGTYAAGSVANRKNLPYISAQDAKDTANEGAGPNDTLTFPDDETIFQVGDEVRVYGDAKGENLLGTVTISNENVVGEITAGTAVKGQVLRLLDDTTHKNFLTSQTEVWIGRMGAGDEAAGKTVNFSEMKKVAITAETPIYYTENAAESAVTDAFGADGTTAAKPISVSFGDSVNEVIKNFDTSDTTTYEVTAENGEKIQASLDWSNLKVENATGNATTDKFNKHGSATIIVPFADKTVDEVTYSQPTAFVDIDTLADKTVPVYGMKLYVDVVPNAADYYIVNDPTDGKSLTLLGETAKALKAGDTIVIDKVDGATLPSPSIRVRIEDKSDATGIQTEYTIDGGLPDASTEAAATAVKVSVYLGDGDYSTAVEVPVVAKGTHDVVSDVTVVGEGEDGMTYITPDATVESIFNSLVPTPAFKVTGSDQKIPMDLTTVTSANVQVQSKNVTDPDTAYADMAYTAFNDEAKTEPGHTDAKNYKLIYTIAPKTEAGAAEGDEQVVLNYTNTNKRKIIVTTSVVTRLKLGMKSGAQEVEVTANNPIGSREKGQDTTEALENTVHWDTFKVKDQYTDVQVKDTVKVYDGTATPITTGLVYKVETIDANNRWVYIKVEQLGREPSNNLSFKVMDDHTPDNDEILPTIKIAMGSNLPKETYSFSKVAAFSPNTFTVVNKKADDSAYANNAEFFAAVKNGDITDIPSQATVEYGYYSAVPVGETVTYMIDPTTVDTVTTDMELSSDTDLTTMAADDEAVAVTVTPDLTGLKTSDNVDIDTTDAAEADKTTTINIKLVSQADAENLAYAGPALTTLAGAVTLTNKAYPTQDNVAISTVGTQDKALSVFFYKTADDADANKALFTATIPAGDSSLADGAIATLPADANKELLAKNGGTFYIRAQQAGGLISAKPASGEYTKVTYGVEPFTLYSVELPESAQTIKKNREDLAIPTKFTDAAALAAYFNNTTSGPLPKVFTVNAVRYVAGATGAVADEANKQTTTVTPAATPWKIANDDNTSSEITADNVSNLLGSTNQKQTNLTATLAETDFAGVKVSFKPNETANLIAADVLYDADNNNAVTAKLYVTEDESDKAFTIPENAAQYIAASNNNSETGDDDTVKFNFSTKGEGDVETPTAPDMAGAWFRFTADGKTYIGQLSTPAPAKKDIDKTTSLIDEAGNTVTFGGFSTSDANVEIKFYESQDNAKADTKGSDGIVMNLGTITGAQKITAAGIENAKSLSFATGVIRSGDDFINMLKGVTTATVTVEGGDTVANVPLKKIGGTSTNKDEVSWTLQSKEGEGEWTTVSDYATEMGTYSATKSYRLTAELDLGEDGTVGETVLENSENKLAEIPITVYNSDDWKTDSTDEHAAVKFPLKLTQGNSDLYTYGGIDNEPAKAKMAELQAENPNITREAFKDDLVVYYLYETYDAKIKPYAEKDSILARIAEADAQKPTLKDATGFDQWLASNPDSWTVEQLTADGKVISTANPVQYTKYDPATKEETPNGTSTHIEPKHSANDKDYVDFNSGYSRLDEEYFIRYTVNYNGQIYVIDRKVKLTYMLGDADFNGQISDGDSVYIKNIIGNAVMFVPKDAGDEAEASHLIELRDSICDLNYDKQFGDADATAVKNILGNTITMPNMRW